MEKSFFFFLESKKKKKENRLVLYKNIQKILTKATLNPNVTAFGDARKIHSLSTNYQVLELR